jgi:hypothetical protein
MSVVRVHTVSARPPCCVGVGVGGGCWVSRTDDGIRELYVVWAHVSVCVVLVVF